MKAISFLLSFFLFSFCLRGQTVADIVVNSPDHNILETAVIEANLVATLSGPGPFTLFAPTDDAFNALPAGALNALLADPTGALTDVLLYHTASGELQSTDLTDGMQITTINGKQVTATVGMQVLINNAIVTVANIPASNGIVHVIDAVLLPPSTVMDIIKDSPVHSILEIAIDSADLRSTLNSNGEFTVFAPTDDAFGLIPPATIAALLANPDALSEILLYHVVAGTALSTDLSNDQNITTINGKQVNVTIDQMGNVFIDSAQVTMADIITDNGVVHVLDAVMLPPVTVMDIIEDSADHDTLEAAIGAAGLTGTLNSNGEFTVFAPTDAAFAALPAGTIDALLADPTGALTDILLYHVVNGTALSTDLSDGQMVMTINGKDVTVTIDMNGDVFINNAQVTMADITTDNGVVHVIDAVLIPPTITVVDVIVDSPDHTILEAAVLAAGLEGTLSGDGPFTVFAPTDAAFAALPAGTIDALLADPTGALTDILLYHVVNGTALSTDLSDGQMVMTINGKDVTVTIDMNGDVFINNAQVTMADITTDNGVVHVIDAVLIPPTITVVDVIVNSPDHTILEAAVLAAGLEGTLSGDGPFTVFAPTDAAFAALPAGTIDALLADPTGALTDILLYHVVNGTALSTDLSDGQMVMTINGKDVTVTIDMNGDVFINNAQVTMADITTDNGVVHVIDAVLIPPTITVVDVIVNSPDHTILEAAVLAAGLEGTLSGDGPFTVFAPTDAAFAALPAGTIDALLADPTGALTDILLYHVVNGTALSTDLSDGQMVMTINGKDVTVTIDMNGDVFINNAQVTMADITTDNGVVHVIDAVLIPPTITVVDVIVNSPDHTILEAAVLAAGLEGTLSGDGPFTVFAPTDAAFAALPAGTIDALLADPTGALTDILLYHVVNGTALSTDLSDGQMVMTINGKDVTVTIDMNGDVFINNAQVTMADITTDNGVVHVIDAVLIPPTITVVDVIVDSPDHTILEAAVLAAGLEGTLSGDGPFTVFAPTDAAFAALPAGTIDALLADPTGALTDILLYHVVNGTALSTDLSDGQMVMTINGKDVTVTIDMNGDVFINNAQVTMADITTDNGVVHVIDAVLIPPTITVVDVIVDSPDHTILETAVLAAGLEGTLSGDGPFTVFAPTDAAFAALPAGTIDALLADPTGALTDILLYHVVNGTALSTDLSDGQSIVTLNGGAVTVSLTGGVFINTAEVTTANIETDNGVVHVIDAVLLPPTAVRELSGEFANVKVFPNPVSDLLTIDMEDATKLIQSTTLVASNGQTINMQKSNSSQIAMNLSNVANGSYYVLIEIDGTYFYQKIQVQH